MLSDFYSVNDMPGPSDEARELQHQQIKAREAFYDAMNTYRDANAPEVNAARDAYLATVQALEDLLGADAHCNHVDCDLWSAFSDAYKGDVGIRPRSYFSRKSVQDWFDNMPSSTSH